MNPLLTYGSNVRLANFLLNVESISIVALPLSLDFGAVAGILLLQVVEFLYVGGDGLKQVRLCREGDICNAL